MQRAGFWSVIGTGAALIGGLIVFGLPVLADKLPAPRTPETALPTRQMSTATAPRAADGMMVRTVIVEWTIKKGREQEFLDYWSKRSTLANREGLITEFLNTVETGETWPWMSWATPVNRPEATIYYNVGLWRDAPSFQEQVGKFIDPARPLLDFEAARRNRIVLAPQRWRTGMTALPAKDSDSTQ